ncbi:uncharacterized protein LOC141690600 [Apium graveolens]|uniref:uncharacterized protein LOC141690600 n=1 Tax=Apium graveolens TaxID=4045 RepID=UPI003D7AF21A
MAESSTGAEPLLNVWGKPQYDSSGSLCYMWSSSSRGGVGGGSSNGSQQNPLARVFALTAHQAVVNSGTISGTFLVGRRDAYVLFDTGSTHSVVSLSFVHHLGVVPCLLCPHISIATPMGNSVIIYDVYQECPIVVGERNYKDTSKDKPHIEDYPVVKDYTDVFPDELPGLPPHREVEVTIELIPGAEPISKAPYRMASLELQKLKELL